MSQHVEKIGSDESAASTGSARSAEAQARQVQQLYAGLRRQISAVFVGQDELVELVLSTLLTGGHALIEGVPGLGKTLLVRTLAAALKAPMSRIQFTPDLMPADITGTTVLQETPGKGHELRFQPGPLVSSIILADEINRATPKTQSALLEAMQEGQVTVGGRTIALPELFIVLATQNPIEQEGTYPLPEAQLDRFLVKLLVNHPTEQEYLQILKRTTGTETSPVEALFGPRDVLEARAVVRQVAASEQVCSYLIRITMATQPDSRMAGELVRKYVAFGAGPRAGQAALLLGKLRALLRGRFAVSCEDIRAVIPAVMRHRLVLNFAGVTERISPDSIIRGVVEPISELTAGGNGAS